MIRIIPFITGHSSQCITRKFLFQVTQQQNKAERSHLYSVFLDNLLIKSWKWHQDAFVSWSNPSTSVWFCRNKTAPPSGASHLPQKWSPGLPRCWLSWSRLAVEELRWAFVSECECDIPGVTLIKTLMLPSEQNEEIGGKSWQRCGTKSNWLKPQRRPTSSPMIYRST